MDFPHFAVPGLEYDGLLIFTLGMDLYGIPDCAIVVEGFGELEKIFGLGLHY